MMRVQSQLMRGLFLSAVAVAMTGPGSAVAGSIGVQFDETGHPLGASDVAGVVAQNNYNVLTGASFSNVALNNNSGASSGAALTVTGTGISTYLTYGGAGVAGTDESLNSGLLNSAEATDLNFTITNIPYASYNLIVYELDNVPRVEKTTVGATTYYLRSPLGNAAGLVDGNSLTPYQYTQSLQTTPMLFADNASPTNYVQFSGLSGSSVTFTVNADITDNDNKSVFVNGFQIVEVPTPEPTSLCLAGGGLIGWIFLHRRKRSSK